MYRLLYRSVLSRVDAERAHHLSFQALRGIDRVPAAGAGVGALMARLPEIAPTEVLGLSFPNRLGLAAGFDKNGAGVRAMSRLGFGSIEVGTITSLAQPGNPQPRMHRLPADEALVNRMGFNNVGAEAAAVTLRRQRELLETLPAPRRPIVGINIGKSKLAEGLDAAIADYAHSATHLAALADYLVINVSSPNTPGLRDLQSTASLGPIIEAVQAAAARSASRPRSALGHVPLLVKIAPDLADEDILDVVRLAEQLGVDGLIATNTTISRSGLRTPAAEIEAAGGGGLSGRPVARRAAEVARLVRAHAPAGMTLIGAGGIGTAAEARARLALGADLVQAYTGMVYGGPAWPARIVAGIS